MFGNITVTNLSDEMFNDGLLFSELAQTATNTYEKWRYFRTSILSFCSSAEAWISMLIYLSLKNKETLNDEEQKLLQFLETPNKRMPKGFTRIDNRLYDFLPNAIDSAKEFNRENLKIEKYIELSKIRNAIVHYSKKDFYRVYGQEIERFSVEAPEIIDNLFAEYSSIFPQIPEAKWFKNRESRVIE